MTRVLMILALVATLFVTTGCQSEKGSREYIPGRGWVPTP